MFCSSSTRTRTRTTTAASRNTISVLSTLIITIVFTNNFKFTKASTYDCECECCLPGTCDQLGTNKYFFNVGDPDLCTTLMCAGEVANCPDIGQHNSLGINRATYTDCECSCCKDDKCPTLTQTSFFAGTREQCSTKACASEFYGCPDPGAHASSDLNFAVYEDCTCGCADDATSELKYNRFEATSKSLCTRAECESRFTTCKSNSLAIISAWYTGVESEEGTFDSSPWDAYSNGQVRITVGSKTVTLSKAEAAGIAVSIIVVVFAFIAYCGYRLHQRRRGYRWMVFDHDEEGRMIAREERGSDDNKREIELSNAEGGGNNAARSSSNTAATQIISSLRDKHGTTDNKATGNNDQMSPYKVDGF